MNYQFDEQALIEFAKRVELISTRVLEGLHRSRRGGEGVEFHSASPFSQGEDIRRIDWKRYASSDRLYVQKFQRYEKSSWTILLDQSPSMTYGAKLEWAKTWVACLAFLAKTWGDSIQVNLEDQIEFPKFFSDLLDNRVGIEPDGFSKISIASKSHILIFSDFFYDLDSIENFIRKNENFQSLHAIQILDPKEKDFSFSGVFQFLDLESKDRLVLDAHSIAKRYHESFRRQQESLKSVSGDLRMHESVAGVSEIESQLMDLLEDLWSL